MLKGFNPWIETAGIYLSFCPIKFTSLHLLNSAISCDVVFYVLRALPLIADKLYYEAPRGVLNCDILRVKTDSYWKSINCQNVLKI